MVRLLNPPAGIAAAEVLFNGGGYPMLQTGDRWYRIIGLSTYTEITDFPIEVVSGGATVTSGIATISDGGFQYESIELPPSSIGLLNDAAAVEQERQTLAQAHAGFTPQKLWSGPWILPVQGYISNVFGLQRSINGAAYFPHSGTDIVADANTPVVAAATGNCRAGAAAIPLRQRGGYRSRCGRVHEL